MTALPTIRVSRAAMRDLDAIYDHIAHDASPARAEKVLEHLREQIRDLARFPERGSWPPELLDLGERDFRQLAVQRWRVFYRVRGAQVHVILIADSRRNLVPLLSRRLLEP